jgi:hypothetical protein
MNVLGGAMAMAIGFSYLGLILGALLISNRVRVRLRNRERVPMWVSRFVEDLGNLELLESVVVEDARD